MIFWEDCADKKNPKTAFGQTNQEEFITDTKLK